MVYLLCSIFDKVVGEYSNPIICRNEADALRWHKNYVSRVDDSSDFDLYSLGTYNSEVGIITSNNPVILKKGVDYYEKK